MKKVLFTVFGIVAVWSFIIQEETVRLGPGILAPDPPRQAKTDSPISFPFKEYTLLPLAAFEVTAKVLAKKDYRWGRESELAPVDLALGWGKMSDENVLDHIDISQSSRWYRWRTDAFPIPRREIETHSGNMHLIPANKGIRSIIERVRPGEIVEFSGSLVRADAKNGWNWVSSLSRADTGAHSCELVWVEQFEIHEF